MKNFLMTILGLLLCSASSAHAEVAYSTFGPNQAFDALNGSIIEGPSSEFPQSIAEPFTPATTLFLDRVELAVSSSLGIPELNIGIYADSGGLPSSELESINISNFADGLLTVAFNGNVQLDAGSNYWLAVSTTGSNGQTWLDTTPTVFGTQAASDDDGATWFSYNTDPFSRAAFLVAGTPTGPVDPPDIAFVDRGAPWRFFRGLAEPSTGVAWTTQPFDDSTWDFGNEGFGYDTDPATQAGLLSHLGTELTDMRDDGVNQDAYSSIYLRRAFTVVNPFEIKELVFEVDYDDSFIAYVNGVEVARSLFGSVGIPEPFDGLGADHESTNGDAGQLLERYFVDLESDFPDLLQAGSSNVLAIQGLNGSLDDDDFVLSQLSLGGNVTLFSTADFNGDGLVDGADLAVWESSFGVDAGADVDGDGDTDGQDFLAWQSQFTGSGGPLGSRAVPEPSAVFLGTIATLIAIVLLRHPACQVSLRSAKRREIDYRAGIAADR